MTFRTFVGVLSALLFARFYGPIGLLIGYFIGTFCYGLLVPQGRNQTKANTHNAQNSRFFLTTFEILGHISKAKGVVTQQDINLATELMDRMALHGQIRQDAQAAFSYGKNPDYPLKKRLQALYHEYRNEPDLLFFFMELQIQAACQDGKIHENEEAILAAIAEELHISPSVYQRYIDLIRNNQYYYHQRSTQYRQADGRSSHYNYQQRNDQQQSSRQSSQRQTRQESNYASYGLRQAFQVLGLEETNDVAAIKQAYRRLMNQHHPDKLAAKGLPPEMMELAKRRTQEIQSAYDKIKQSKNFK